MQTENYLFSGQNYGVSPRDFFFNLTDFSESAENRQLVRMHVCKLNYFSRILSDFLIMITSRPQPPPPVAGSFSL